MKRDFYFWYDGTVPFGIQHVAAITTCMATQDPGSVTVLSRAPITGYWVRRINPDGTRFEVLDTEPDPVQFLKSKGSGIWSSMRVLFRASLEMRSMICSDPTGTERSNELVIYDGVTEPTELVWFPMVPGIKSWTEWNSIVHCGSIDIPGPVLITTTDTVCRDIEALFEQYSTYTKLARRFFTGPDFSDVEIVVPVQIDSLDRVENVLVQLQDIRRRIDPATIIVVEYGPQPYLETFVRQTKGTRYTYIQSSPEVPWARGLVANIGVQLVQTPIFGVFDADIFVPLKQHIEAVAKIRSKEVSFASPSDQHIGLKRRCLYSFKSGLIDYNQFTPDIVRSRVPLGNDPFGGAFYGSTGTFRHIRGFSEAFKGWGWEDIELSNRVEKLGYKTWSVNGPGYHIDHIRTATSTPNHTNRVRALQELSKIHTMNRNQICVYYGITSQDSIWTTGPEPLKSPTHTLSDDYADFISTPMANMDLF